MVKLRADGNNRNVLLFNVVLPIPPHGSPEPH